MLSLYSEYKYYTVHGGTHFSMTEEVVIHAASTDWCSPRSAGIRAWAKKWPNLGPLSFIPTWTKQIRLQFNCLQAHS